MSSCRHITRYEVSRKEREWDPIHAKFRDSSREEAQRSKEIDKLMKQRMVAREKQLQAGTRWNIVTNVTYSDAPPAKPRDFKPTKPSSYARYNILNNVPHTKQGMLKTVPSPNE